MASLSAVVLEGVASQTLPDAVARVERVFVQRTFPRGEVLLQLGQRASADDDGIDGGLRREPAEGKRYGGDARRCGNFHELIDRVKVPFAPVTRVVLLVEVESCACRW